MTQMLFWVLRADPPARHVIPAFPVAACIVTLYVWTMIKSFRHLGLRRFFETGTKAGIQPKHAKRLRLQLGRLDSATTPEDMNMPGWRFHALKGELNGHWAIWVDENWRLTFRFDGKDAEIVDYQDYH